MRGTVERSAERLMVREIGRAGAIVGKTGLRTSPSKHPSAPSGKSSISRMNASSDSCRDGR